MKRVLVTAALLGMAAAACGSSDTSTTSGAGATSSGAASSSSSSTTISSAATPTPVAQAAVVVVANNTKLGEILVNAQGATLYYYTPEKGGTIACTGSCLTNWPALTPSAGGKPSGGPGVTGSLGVVALPGGGSAVTYNSWPLHTFVGDHNPGDTTGQGAASGKWLAATPGLAP
jgi:predicted lipoprotein with Yx(FWY)xxD motif